MSTQLTPASQQTGIANTQQPMPAHLIKAVGEKPLGLDIVRQYVRPPRAKIVQPQSGAELRQAFPDGTVIMQPGNVLISEMPFDAVTRRHLTESLPFTFVPLFFYPEYFIFNPIAITSLPTIRERSTDPKSEIAARARNKNLWTMPCPEDTTGKEVCRFVEVLTYVVHISSVSEPALIDALWGKPLTMTFARGEHKTGTKFSGDIMLRKADIFANVFQANTAQRVKDRFQWFGYNITAPMQGSQWVESAEEFAYYKGLFEDLASAHAQGLLLSEQDDDDNVIDATPTVNANAPNAQY